MAGKPVLTAGGFEGAVAIHQWDGAQFARHLDEFAALLHACVMDGASIGFVDPFDIADALAFWRDGILPSVQSGGRDLFVATCGDRIAGTVQLDCATMPNQAHRGEICKLMVHPGARRRGIARQLMQAVETRARDHGRSLLTLDTRTGDSAEPLYIALGFVVAGMIPGYARDPFSEKLSATTIMYKHLL